MPTIGEVYGPIIAARDDPERFEALLREVGERIFEESPDRCPDVEDGCRAARKNLEYYAQYHSQEAGRRQLSGGRRDDRVGAAGRDEGWSGRMGE